MGNERRERLAIALADLDRMPGQLRARLLAGKLDLENVIRHAGQHRLEEVTSVIFSCSLLTAAKICDIIRSNDRAVKEEPTRLFVKRGATWVRIPLDVMLTVAIGHDVVLNPAVFPAEVQPKALTPPPVKTFRIGQKKESA